MPLEGTLDTLSLSSLIQAFCLERKQLRLTLTNQAGARGELYFARGEIIHAVSATLSGESALYQLLTWPDAIFRTTSLMVLPAQTIHQRWDQLLLEGMRRLDEDNRHTAPATTVTPDQRRHEEDIAEKLLTLLGQLEQLNQRLRESRVQRSPAAALECLTQMVNQTLTVFHELAAHASISAAARQSMHQVLAPYLAQVPHEANGQRLAAAALLREYQDSPPATKPETFAHLVQRLNDVLAYAYFAIIASFFRSADIKAQWTEAYNVFFAERQQSLSSIDT